MNSVNRSCGVVSERLEREARERDSFVCLRTMCARWVGGCALICAEVAKAGPSG